MSEKTNNVLTMILGILMIFCGVVALGSPFTVGALMTIVIGVMMVVGGTAEMMTAFTSGFKAGLLIFLAGLLSVIAGGVVIANPMAGSAMFTILMSIFFISDGIIRSIFAFKARPTQGWGFVLFSGIISVLLGILLIRGWPISGMLAIGIFAGIRLLFGGMNILTLGTVANEE